MKPEALNLSNWYRLSVTWLCLLAPIWLCGQQHNYRHYTVRDGLASTVVYDVHQDKLGYIWLATMEGVVRFDGYRFEVFTVADGLPSNEVLGLWEDKPGRIWMLCFRKGLALFTHDTIMPIQLDIPVEDLPLKSFVPDTLGNLWLTTANSDIVLYNDSVISRLSINDITSYRFTEPVLMPDNKGHVWIGGEKELFLWRDSIMWQAQVDYQGSLVSPLKPLVTTSGEVFLISARNVWVSNNAEMKPVASFSDDVNIFRAAPGKDGSILLATSVGAVRLHGSSSSRMIAEWFLRGKSISRVIEDAEGSYWMTTLNDGVYVLTQSSRQIVNLNEENGLFAALPGAITVVDDELVISSKYGDVYAFTKRNGYGFQFLKNHRLCANLGSCYIMPDSSTWCSTSVGFLNLEDRGIHNMKPLHFIEQVVSHKGELEFGEGINCINIGAVKQSVVIDDSIIVAVSHIGLYAINTNPGTRYHTTRYVPDRCSAVTFDEVNRTLWVASVKGLFYWPIDEPFELHRDSSLAMLQEEPINHLSIGHNNQLVIGTTGRGVYLKNKDGVVHYGVQNGLTSDIVNHTLLTPYGLLIATSKGICVLHGNHNEGYTLFPAAFNDGLLSQDVKQTLIWENHLYVLTTKGLTVVSPEALQPDTMVPVTHISGFAIGGKDTTILPVYTLPHYSNSIAIEYVGLLFKTDGNILYRYQMEGIDTAWVQTSFTNVQYPTLPPGKYTFKVDSRSAQGPWSDKPATVTIKILPPFWQTWWFRLLIGLAAIAIVTAISYSIIRYYRNQSLIAQRMVELEGNALRANMNPHFVFNALNAIHDFIANSDEKSAHIYLGKFAKLIRRILDQSRKNFISLEEELDTLTLYLELENMRFEHKFRFEINIEDGIQPYDVELPPMLIQPYLENAVRHGLMNLDKAGKITVSFRQQEQYLECTITDNGVGRAKAMEIGSKRLKSHRSVGMDITQKRVELLHEAGKDNKGSGVAIADLVDGEGLPIGTKVSILLPLKEV